MTRRAFIDSNVIVNHLVQNHEEHARRSTQLLEAIEREEVIAFISATVVLETMFTVTRRYKVPSTDVASAVLEIVQLPSIVCPDKDVIVEALEFCQRAGALSFADCLHLVLTRHFGLTEIYSFDKKMGRYPGVERIEP